MSRLHRNNAAEWVMAIALFPVKWIVRVFAAGRKKKEEVKKPAARSVMIEGLPPRTMN
jgi:hypothetical protein